MREREVAHRLGITVADLDVMRNELKLPTSIFVGGVRFFRQTVIDEWAKSNGLKTPNDWREFNA